MSGAPLAGGRAARTRTRLLRARSSSIPCARGSTSCCRGRLSAYRYASGMSVRGCADYSRTSGDDDSDD